MKTEDEPAPEPEREDLLGLSIAPLTDELRERYGIGQSIEGVVITEVKPNSPAAQKDVKPGDVIVEVTQEKVKQPQDVKARLLAVKKSGRRSVLLLLSDAKGELQIRRRADRLGAVRRQRAASHPHRRADRERQVGGRARACRTACAAPSSTPIPCRSIASFAS